MTFYEKPIFEYGGNGFFFDISKGIYKLQNAELICIIDTMMVCDMSYYDVVQIRLSDAGGDDYYYWVKNIGLIKKIDETGTWLLKKYYINN